MTFLIKTGLAVAIVYAMSPLRPDMPALGTWAAQAPQAAQAARAVASLSPQERETLARLAGEVARQGLTR